VGEEEAKYKAIAIKKICEHLSDEEQVHEGDLDEFINPREKQRIYLVAADYPEDVTSACAWLREYEIDVSCFRLRPYKIGDQYVLQRERLIPPPELDDFMVDTKVPMTVGDGGRIITRAKPIKPVKMTWGLGGEQIVIEVGSWKAFLEKCAIKALQSGLPVSRLPMRKRTLNGDFNELGEDDRAIFIESSQVYIDCNADANTIKKWVVKIREELEQPIGFITVETAEGEQVEL
jgi:hypothetical protein